MGNLIDIQSQIEKLQKQANDIKAKEFAKTIKEIVALMQAYGITLKDLQTAGSRREKAKASAKPKPARNRVIKSAPVAAKYSGPNGETWSGRGLTPRWLSALLSQGRQKEDFVIKS